MQNYYDIDKYNVFLKRMHHMKNDAIYICACAKNQQEKNKLMEEESRERKKKEVYELEMRKELFNEIYFRIFFLKNKKIFINKNNIKMIYR